LQQEIKFFRRKAVSARPTRYTFTCPYRAGCAGKAVAVKNLDSCGVLCHDIMYNHVGSNRFRHVSYPHVQQGICVLLAVLFVIV
jgi:hypothetical protein